MKTVHIVGRKKHGKTTLIGELVRELVGQGLRVGTIKHCGHDHELDTPGTDSFRHREVGASSVAVVTPSLFALYEQRNGDEDIYAHLRDRFEGFDLVLIEGNTDGPGPKVEIWREEVGTAPWASERDDIVLMVTDDSADFGVPLWPRSDIAGLSREVLKMAKEV